MATAYTPILQLALPVTGELQGTWGTVVNDNITSMIEQAIAGLATINTWTTASHTLTTANGTTSEARCAVLECSGAPGAAASVICPASTKLYVIKNSVTGGYAVTLKTSAGTGISVPNGSTALLYCDGTNVVSGATYMATVSTTQVDILAQGDLRLQDTTGGEYVALQAPATLAASYTLTMPVDDGTAGQALITDGSGVLSWSTAASGDVYGPASATDNAIARFDLTTGKLIQNSVVTIADTTGNMAGVGTLSSGAITSSSLTAGRVPYAGTAGLIQDAAALTFDGTILSATRFAGALNGTVGATTPSTGAFTTLSGTGQLTLTNASDYNLYASGAGGNYMAGALGIGSTSLTAMVLRASKSITGGTSAWGIRYDGAVLSGVTAAAYLYSTYPSTQAAAFTLGNLFHYQAGQGTLGAGSAVTNQYGFAAGSDLTGATNNFGFYSDIASGTGRYNFYANGTADNYMAGSLGIGSTTTADTPLRLTLVGTATNINGVRTVQVTPATATASHKHFQTVASTVASVFTLTNLTHYEAFQSTIGAGSTVTSQYGFYAQSNLTGATNNYGFYSAIASGTGRYNFYAVGTAQNYFAGATGIGDLPSGNGQLRVAGAAPAVTDSWGIISQASSQASSSHNAFYSLPTVSATSTLSQLNHYYASQSTFANTVTNQRGFTAESNLTGATNNYGFYGNIASGTGRYNFYANGTADNYFAGNVGIGTTTITNKLEIGGSGNSIMRLLASGQANGLEIGQLTADGSSKIFVANNNFLAVGTNNTERLRIAAAGTISLGATAGSESLRVTPVASAVNYVEVLGASTGVSPVLQSTGSDTNVNAVFATKGTGAHLFRTNGNTANTQFQISHTASAVNYITAFGNTTGSGGYFQAAGSDTNISMLFSAKGTGGHDFYTAGNSFTRQFAVTHTASAVNYLQVSGNVTGQGTVLSSQGSDANVNMLYLAKGTGKHGFGTGGGAYTEQFAVTHTASAVNYLQVTGGATTAGVNFSAQGSDTNIFITYDTKGTEAHSFRTNAGAQQQFRIAHTASAVNYLQATGGATGVGATLSSQGSDTNVGMTLQSKGTFSINLTTGGGIQTVITNTASAVNYHQMTGSATGTAIVHSAQGTDTNIDLALTPKGTGVLAFGTYTAGVIAQAGYISIKDAGGTTRRLLVG